MDAGSQVYEHISPLPTIRLGKNSFIYDNSLEHNIYALTLTAPWADIAYSVYQNQTK